MSWHCSRCDRAWHWWRLISGKRLPERLESPQLGKVVGVHAPYFGKRKEFVRMHLGVNWTGGIERVDAVMSGLRDMGEAAGALAIAAIVGFGATSLAFWARLPNVLRQWILHVRSNRRLKGRAVHRIAPGAAVLAVLWVAAPAMVAASPACLAEKARYDMIGHADEFSLRLHPADITGANLGGIGLTLKTPQRSYRFALTMSQGYGGTLLVPLIAGRSLAGSLSSDVIERLRLYALDDGLAVLEAAPERGESAPRYLFLPELGNILWYSPQSLTEDPRADRDPMPRGMFKLAGCMP